MKKVVITGGNGDIAKAIADELKRDSEHAYIVLLPTREQLDVTDVRCVNEYFRRECPDVLINNAGAILLDGIERNNIAEHRRVIAVNLTGVFACAGAGLQANPKLKIINIGSSAGTKVHGNWSSYCASKAAVIMATACWAEEGVDAICISPGRTVTKMRRSMYPNEEPNSLMRPEDFAVVVRRAMEGHYPRGCNLDVNVNNVKNYIHG